MYMYSKKMRKIKNFRRGEGLKPMFMFVTNQNSSPTTITSTTIGAMISRNTIRGRLLHQVISRNISLNIENHDLGKLF
jgi:hypothetical protein